MFNNQPFFENLVQSLGLTIVDTLWQGLLIGVVLFILLSFTRSSSSGLRYRMSLLALLLMFFCAGYSFVNHCIESSQTAVQDSNLSIEYLNILKSENAEVTLTNAYGITPGILFLENYLSQHTSVITGIWLCGIFLLCLKLIGGMIYIHQLKSKCRKVDDGFWNRQLTELKTLVGVNKLPEFLESAMVSAPMTLGYIRPVIILPIGMLTGVPTEQIESILIHELVHIKKADYFVNILQSLLEIIFFYHPATWFISHMIQKERENRCDQITVELIDNPLCYAQALTAIHETDLYVTPKLAMSTQSGKGDLTMRIFRIMNIKRPQPYKSRVLAVLLAISMSVSFFSFDAPQKLSGKPIAATQIVDVDPSYNKAIPSVDNPGNNTATKSRKEVLHDPDLPLTEEVQLAQSFHWEEMPIKTKTDPADTTKKNLGLLFENGLQPIYYLDDKRIDADQVESIDMERMASIEVLKGEKALEKFGSEAKNGVVLMYTKSKKSSTGTYRIGKPLSEVKVNGIKGGKEVSENELSPIYFMDGKRIDADQIGSIDTGTIYSVEVLKGEKALKEFGPEAKNGVVLVHAKSEKSSTGTLRIGKPLSEVKVKGVKTGKESSENGLSPIYYLDDKRIDADQMESIDQATIASVEVLKGEKALKKFGPEAKNGVVQIYSKLSISKEKKKELLKPMKNKDKRFSGQKMKVGKGDALQQALIIIDGKESNMKWKELESDISSTEIESVNILREKSAITKYGIKGENGVVEITTKKNKSSDKSSIESASRAEIFPNPSSNQFNIRFKLEKKSKVQIGVYDLNGKLVDKITRKSLNKGPHEIKWAPVNVPSGNYILHINMGKDVIKKQIIIE